MEVAIERMRSSLFRFLEHHNVDNRKYNETLTVFWLEMVALELKKIAVDASLVDKFNSVIAALNNAKLACEFYSEQVLWSDEARRTFVPPDLKHWK